MWLAMALVCSFCIATQGMVSKILLKRLDTMVDMGEIGSREQAVMVALRDFVSDSENFVLVRQAQLNEARAQQLRARRSNEEHTIEQ